MARVTVEDCALVVENRFELVALATKRTKDIYSGSPITVDRDNDKNPVIALREIADRKVDADTLREHVIQSFQKKLKNDTIENDEETGQDLAYVDTDIIDEIESFGVEEDPFEEEVGFTDESDLSDSDD